MELAKRYAHLDKQRTKAVGVFENARKGLAQLDEDLEFEIAECDIRKQMLLVEIQELDAAKTYLEEQRVKSLRTLGKLEAVFA